ncbi:MAG TPA: porin [Steroidobacteraceae bacterium]|nr:porin [Steroidobacteraceae bacterium]
MKRLFSWATLITTLIWTGAALADEKTEAQLLQRLEQQEERIKILERRLEIQDETAQTSVSSAQDERIKILERRLEIQDEATQTVVSSTPIVQASSKGFSFRSPDGANQVRLRGVLQVDGRFMQDDAGLGAVDTWSVTRARPIIEGTLANFVDFRLTPDFGQGRTVIQDAFITARLTPQFRITAGKFKSPFGLERLQSATDIRFVARAFPTSLVPNRDIGLAFEGDVFGGRFSYALGYSNGVIDGGSSETLTDTDVDDDKELIVRLFTQPFANSDRFALRGLGFGIAAGRSDSTGTAAQPLLPAFRTSPQQTFFRYRAGATPTIADGERLRYSPQFYYYVGSFGLIGEYVQVSQEVSRALAGGISRGRINSNAWQLAASWFLTGEEAAFRGYTPSSTFKLGESWGAFELTARYHELDIDDEAFLGGANSFADPEVSASKASAIEVGLNWYLSQNLKWVLNYGVTRFEGGTPGGDRDNEKFFLTRFALGF